MSDWYLQDEHKHHAYAGHLRLADVMCPFCQARLLRRGRRGRALDCPHCNADINLLFNEFRAEVKLMTELSIGVECPDCGNVLVWFEDEPHCLTCKKVWFLEMNEEERWWDDR